MLVKLEEDLGGHNIGKYLEKTERLLLPKPLEHPSDVGCMEPGQQPFHGLPVAALEEFFYLLDMILFEFNGHGLVIFPGGLGIKLRHQETVTGRGMPEF